MFRNCLYLFVIEAWFYHFALNIAWCLNFHSSSQESSRACSRFPVLSRAWKNILAAFCLSIVCIYHWKSNHLGKGCWNTMLFPPSHRNPSTDLPKGTSGCFSGGNLVLGTSLTGSLWLSALCQKPVFCSIMLRAIRTIPRKRQFFWGVGFRFRGVLPEVCWAPPSR